MTKNQKMKVDGFIKILQKQLDALSDKEFDLEAWKKGTIARLGSVYGPDDSRIEQLEQIKIDYSSWALRDSNSSYKPVESCKKVGKAIVEAIIDDVKVFGFSKNEPTDNSPLLLKILDETQREEFGKLMEHPADKSFKKFLQSLSKKELADVIVTLMDQED